MSNASSVSDLLKSASSLIKSNNISEARSVLRLALEKDPQNADIWFLISRTTTDQQQRLQALQRALKIDPSHTYALRDVEKLTRTSDSDLPPFSSTSVRMPAQPSPNTSKQSNRKHLNIALILAGIVIALLVVGGLIFAIRGGVQTNQQPTSVALAGAEEKTTAPMQPSVAVSSATPLVIAIVVSPSIPLPTPQPPTATVLPTVNPSNAVIAGNSSEDTVKSFFLATQSGDNKAMLSLLDEKFRITVTSAYSNPSKSLAAAFDDIQAIKDYSTVPSVPTSNDEQTTQIILQMQASVHQVKGSYCQIYKLNHATGNWLITMISATVDCGRTTPDAAVKSFFLRSQTGIETKAFLGDTLRASIVVNYGSPVFYFSKLYEDFKTVEAPVASVVNISGDKATIILKVHATQKKVAGDYCSTFSLSQSNGIWSIDGIGKSEICK
jgi:hypothetical protein